MTKQELQDTQPPFPIDAPGGDFHQWTSEQWAQLEAWESWHDQWRAALLHESAQPVTLLYPGGETVTVPSLAEVPAPPAGLKWESLSKVGTEHDQPLLRLSKKEEE